MDEDFKNLVMECNNCHLKFYATELKVDPKTDLLTCMNCLSFPGSKVEILRDRLPERKSTIFKQQQKAKEEKDDLERADLPHDPVYKCSNCQYAFKPKTAFRGKCPYCSQKSCREIERSEYDGKD